jgi:hypothetical protein
MAFIQQTRIALQLHTSGRGTRLLTLSSSLMSNRNDAIHGFMYASIGCGRSTIVYFIAITTVALVKADGLAVRSCKKCM